ncbi:protein Niban 1a isoform X2 [Hypanus sabinus]|uniref:protein Niban 1a isoform X2 n=1 Tax=Hypanus sabinus TaxID=79690 RepID=UPI0028C3F912|nr:protein Niban 1a isoform X2 [Hypanus sabinus]
MGGSVSSLDESKCNYIRGKAEAELKNFSPHYQRQYPVTFFNHIRHEIEQGGEVQPQLLRQKEPVDTGTVVYEQVVIQYVEELKKWRDRYIVVKNDNSIECYENKDAYRKGGGPKCKLHATGCRVLTSMAEYTLLVDKYFPDPSGTNGKDGNQCLVVNHTQYPVYLWHPFRKHNYFCFENEEEQQGFGAVLNDCIRHLNYEFAKQNSVEAQVFSEAIQFFRQEKGHYGSWEMNHGDEVLILSNLVMEELLPTLQSDLLPKLKGKKNERKKVWFSIVEDAYNLVQTHLTDGLQSLRDECKKTSKELEGVIRSDMDQIIASKEFTAGKLKATVTETAEQCCVENIRPYLASVLEELMGLVSSGFSEVRALFEAEVNELSPKYQNAEDEDKLKEDLAQLMKLPFNAVKMQPCYNKVSPLQDQLQELKNRFKFTNTLWLVQTTQNFMQELMDNAVYTFEKLLNDSLASKTSKTVTSIEKVKQRVLKQYDHDSSTVRKKLFQEALVQITLPTLQKTLAPNYKRELQKFEQYIFADYTKLVQVENIYEEILLDTIIKEVIKVVQEAAILKKHNLFEDNLPYTSDSDGNLTDKNEGKTPPGSQPRSPAKTPPKDSCAEGMEVGEKVISQISAPISDILLNEKPESEQSSTSHEKSGNEILHSKPNGMVVTELDVSVVEESSSTAGNYQEGGNAVELNSTNNKENLSRIECQDRQETEKEKENATTPAPDSLKEIHDLLTVAVVPTEDQEPLLCKGNDASHVEVHTESSPKVDEHLEGQSEMKSEDVTSVVESVEVQPEKVEESEVKNLLVPAEELVERQNREDEPKSLTSIADELVEGQDKKNNECKGSPSIVDELVQDQSKEDQGKEVKEDEELQSTVDEVVEVQGKENNNNDGSPVAAEEVVEVQDLENNEEEKLQSTVGEVVKFQVKEGNEEERLQSTVDEVVKFQVKEGNEEEKLQSTVDEVVKFQVKEGNEEEKLQSTVDEVVKFQVKEGNEEEKLQSTVDEVVKFQVKEGNEEEKLQSTVDEVVEVQSKENDNNDSLPVADDELVKVQDDDNECKGLSSTINQLVENEEKEDNECKNLSSTVDDPTGQEKQGNEDLSTTTNEPPQGQGEVATEDEKKDMSQKASYYPENETSADSVESDAVSGTAPTLIKEEAEEIASIHTVNTEVPHAASENEEEKMTQNQDEAKEDDKSSQM